jgi:hypothetical protein
MLAETLRPSVLGDVLGHEEPKQALSNYLTNKPYRGTVFLTGTPGIGKTTLALSAARTYGFDPLEINASKSIRSFTDVEKLRDACRAPVNIQSLIRNEIKKTTCVILDELDGSDPHAQRKIMEWILDVSRCVPILCTGNDVPSVFKRNPDDVKIVRCFPPRPGDFERMFPGVDVKTILKECQHDVRRVCHRLQYGKSDTLPKYTLPPTGLGIEDTFVRYQAMFQLKNPYKEQ